LAWDRRYGEFVQELLADLGEVRIRPMFGGAGVFSGELMFGLLFEDTLYLRGDDENEPALKAAGARQFVYAPKNGEASPMRYWSLPDTAADDPDEAVAWARGSLAAAARKETGKRN